MKAIVTRHDTPENGGVFFLINRLLIALDDLGKFFVVIAEQGEQGEWRSITGLRVQVSMFAAQIELAQSLLGHADQRLVFEVILFPMEPFYPEGMPELYGIGIDLGQLYPAAFADGERKLDGTTDEPAPLAGGTAPGNRFTGRQQYLADPLDARAAAVFLAAPARDALVLAEEKPIECDRGQGHDRAENEMGIDTHATIYLSVARSGVKNELYRAASTLVQGKAREWLRLPVMFAIHDPRPQFRMLVVGHRVVESVPASREKNEFHALPAALATCDAVVRKPPADRVIQPKTRVIV